MFHTYRVKPIPKDDIYAVQRKIFIWWTIKYFSTYNGADRWIDHLMEE